MFQNSLAGTGNYLNSFYNFRLAARVLGNVDVLITCPDAEQQKKNLILPWVMGLFRESTARSSELPTKEERHVTNSTGFPLRIC